MTLLLLVVTGVTDFLFGFSVTLLPSIVTDVTFFFQVNCAPKKTKKVWKECMGSLVHGITVLEVCTKRQTNICCIPIYRLAQNVNNEYNMPTRWISPIIHYAVPTPAFYVLIMCAL